MLSLCKLIYDEHVCEVCVYTCVKGAKRTHTIMHIEGAKRAQEYAYTHTYRRCQAYTEYAYICILGSKRTQEYTRMHIEGAKRTH